MAGELCIVRRILPCINDSVWGRRESVRRLRGMWRSSAKMISMLEVIPNRSSDLDRRGVALYVGAIRRMRSPRLARNDGFGIACTRNFEVGGGYGVVGREVMSSEYSPFGVFNVDA